MFVDSHCHLSSPELAGRIPEIRAAVDWYEGHLVIAEYQRGTSGGVVVPRTMLSSTRAMESSSI